MKRIINTLICFVIIVTAVSFAGCSSSTSNSTISDIKTYSDFIEALKLKGYKIDEVKPTEDDLKHSFFSVYAKYIDIDKDRIAIYEFSDKETAIAEAKTISKDGFRIGNAMIDWIDRPHFYTKGNLIVGYVGSNDKLLENLEEIFGKAVTS